MSIRKELDGSPTMTKTVLRKKAKPKIADDLVIADIDDDDLISNSSEGSDSDPSGDEMSLKDIIKSGGLRNMLKPESKVMKMYKLKRPHKSARRPSSASSRRPVSLITNSKSVLKVSAPQSSLPDNALKDSDVQRGTPNISVKSTSTKVLTTPNFRAKPLLSRAYEKFNFSKETESSLLRAMNEPYVMLSNESHDMVDNFFSVPPPRQHRGSSELNEGVFTSDRQRSSPSSKLKTALKSRGIFFPSKNVSR
jgi:hypothetical protein